MMVPYEKHGEGVQNLSVAVSLLSVSFGTYQPEGFFHGIFRILAGQRPVYEIVEHIHYDNCTVLFHIIPFQIP